MAESQRWRAVREISLAARPRVASVHPHRSQVIITNLHDDERGPRVTSVRGHAVSSTLSSDTRWRIVRSPGRCIRLRGGSDCSECMQACPFCLPLENAAELLGETAMGRCTGCGACARVCPTGALSLRPKTASRLLGELVAAADQGNGDTAADLRITCESSSVEADVVVRCVATVDESMVLHAWAHGSRSVSLLPGRCDRCEIGPRHSDMRGFDVLRGIGDCLSPPRQVDMRHTEPDQAGSEIGADVPLVERGLDRRGFFGMLRARAIDTLGSPDDVDDSPCPSEHGAGATAPGRTRTIAALQGLAHEIPADRCVVPDAPPGMLSVTTPASGGGECTFCGVCVRFCPVGALRLRDVDGEARLSVSPSRCVGCGLCVELCESGALELKSRALERVLEPRRILLARGRTAVCTVCRERFAMPVSHPVSDTGQTPELCPHCLRRAERFKGLY